MCHTKKRPHHDHRGGAVRVGDAERSDTLERLAAHFAAGRLTEADLEERTSAAAAAVTRADLAALLDDLPRLPRPPGERRRAALAAHAWHLTWALPTSLAIVL